MEVGALVTVMVEVRRGSIGKHNNGNVEGSIDTVNIYVIHIHTHTTELGDMPNVTMV